MAEIKAHENPTKRNTYDNSWYTIAPEDGVTRVLVFRGGWMKNVRAMIKWLGGVFIFRVWLQGYEKEEKGTLRDGTDGDRGY